jgi:hypothetical protein
MVAVRGGKVFGPSGAKPLPKAGDLSSNHRRVVAKFGYRSASPGMATARANYLSREGATETREDIVRYLGAPSKTREAEPFFDARRERVSRQEVAQDLAKGKRVCSLILNPLDSDRRGFNARQFSRATMAAVERDLGFKPGQLHWRAVVHQASRFDRDRTRHVHVVWSSQHGADRRFDMWIAKPYVRHGFALRASEALERQLGRMKPHEMARLREQMEANRERGRPDRLKGMDRAGAHIADIRKAGREWAGATYQREPRRADYPKPTTRQLSPQGAKWVGYFFALENAPDAIRGKKRELIGMVKNERITPERMDKRVRELIVAQALHERTRRAPRSPRRGVHKSGRSSGVFRRKPIWANPVKRQPIWQNPFGRMPLVEVMTSGRGALIERIRDGMTTFAQGRRVERLADRKMAELSERRELEREHRASGWRPRSVTQQQMRTRIDASNARWAERQRDHEMERGR